MITINDIAKEVGTSHATVSRALNDNSRINNKTKRKILETAQEMGYRPARFARALRTGKTRDIGLILPDFSNPFYAEFLKIVESELILRNYDLTSFEFDLDATRQRSCLERALEYRCEGVIAFFGTPEPFMDLFNEFYDKNIPCIVPYLHENWRDIKVDGVVSNTALGIECAVNHLVAMGHKNIVLVWGGFGETTKSFWEHFEYSKSAISEKSCGDDRWYAFDRVMLKNNIRIGPENILISSGGYQLVDGVNAAKMLVETHPATTAVICQNDLLATGFLKGITDLGYKVPGDISVIGSDNTWLSQYSTPTLTTIDLSIEKTARTCVDLLFDRINNKNKDRPKRIPCNVDLIVRKSTGPVRKEKKI